MQVLDLTDRLDECHEAWQRLERARGEQDLDDCVREREHVELGLLVRVRRLELRVTLLGILARKGRQLHGRRARWRATVGAVGVLCVHGPEELGEGGTLGDRGRELGEL